MTIWNSNIELNDNTRITSPGRRLLDEEDEEGDSVRNIKCFLDCVGSESKTKLILLYFSCVCVCVCVFKTLRA
jgi:hypothetical protein